MRMLAAIKMLLLDAALMDLHDNDLNNSGFHKPLVDVTLDSFANDDECEAKTRFTKGAISTIIGALHQPDIVYLYFQWFPQKYYKCKVESLIIYMLRTMSTARTHCDLCDSEFGGCSR